MESMQRCYVQVWSIYLVRAQVDTKEVFGRSAVEREVNKVNKEQ
jgi:hypothetical protein